LMFINGLTAPSFLPFFTGFAFVMILFSVSQFLGSRSCGRTASSAICAPKPNLQHITAIYREISGFPLWRW